MAGVVDMGREGLMEVDMRISWGRRRPWGRRARMTLCNCLLLICMGPFPWFGYCGLASTIDSLPFSMQIGRGLVMS